MENSPFYTYMSHVAQTLTFFPSGVNDLVNLLMNAKLKGYTVFTCGNGGSAATASHLSNDLAKALQIKTLCLNESIPLLTAWSNDVDYDIVFSAQLALLAQPKDVLFAISTSGRSKNVLSAVDWANKNQMDVIALSGLSDSPLSEVADITLRAKHSDIKIQEDIHSVYCHAIVHAVQDAYSQTMSTHGANNR